MRRSIAGLFALASGLVIAHGAWAADIPVPAAPLPVPVFNWTGFYIGANAGYSWGRSDADYSQAAAGGAGFGAGPCTTACTLSYSVNPGSFIGGIQLGYNYQAGPWVMGLVTDIDWRGKEASSQAVLNTLKDRLTLTDRQQWVGTLRGNLGLAPAGASNWLFYVTAGLAYGRFEHSVTQLCNMFCAETVAFAGDKTKAGWTLGGGTSVAINSNWSAGIEYLYMDFGTDTLTSTAGVALPIIIPATSVDFHDHSHVARFTLNYRFGP